MNDNAPIKCVECGKFAAYDEMQDGSGNFYHEPDNEFGPEVNEWTCNRCVLHNSGVGMAIHD